MSIDEFLLIPDKEKWRKEILKVAVEKKDFSTIFADIIYLHYDMLE